MLNEEIKKAEDKRGRPKDLSLNKEILSTTINLIAEKGYDSLTVDAVAKKTKVGKGTIYRRWATKKELVIAAAILMSPFEISKETLNKDQGVREQFVDLLNLLFMDENKNYQRAISAICNALEWNEQSAIREAFNLSYYKVVESILNPYIKDSLLTKEDLQLVMDIGPALIMYKNISNSDFDNKKYVEQIVDKLIIPLLPN